MLTLAHPTTLLLLLALFPLIWLWRRAKGPGLIFPDVRLLAELPPGRSRWIGYARLSFWSLALALLIVCAAGPRWPDEGSRITTDAIAIQIVQDVSGSMAERDFKSGLVTITRLEAAKKMFRLFVAGGRDGSLSGHANDLIGLVTFARWPESRCPLTFDHAALLSLLDAEQPRRLPNESQTNIGDAIALGLHRLESAPEVRKVMLLLTDGEHNVPPPALTPVEAARLAANLSVPIYVIDASGSLPPDSLKPDQSGRRLAAANSLQAIAQITGGRYFRAGDMSSLMAVCQTIDRLQRAPVRSFVYAKYHEGYAWFGLAALIVLLIGTALNQTVWRKLPA
jgi:Ca-activated chloride channel family protein